MNVIYAEYGFMPSLQLYLVEKSDNPRPIVIIAPDEGYTVGSGTCSRMGNSGKHQDSIIAECF